MAPDLPERQACAPGASRGSPVGIRLHGLRWIAVREVGWHEGWRRGNIHRIICDPIIYPFETRITQRRVMAVGGTKNIARRGDPLIDRGFGNVEFDRDLLRSLAFKQEIEAGALFLGQPIPKRAIGEARRLLTIHFESFRTKLRVHNP